MQKLALAAINRAFGSPKRGIVVLRGSAEGFFLFFVFALKWNADRNCLSFLKRADHVGWPRVFKTTFCPSSQYPGSGSWQILYDDGGDCCVFGSFLRPFGGGFDHAQAMAQFSFDHATDIHGSQRAQERTEAAATISTIWWTVVCAGRTDYGL